MKWQCQNSFDTSCCRNQGTGKGCAKASDGTGGPKCEGSQVGLCCDPTRTSDNCLTLTGDGKFLGAGVSSGKVPQCSDFSGNGGATLQAYCCDEMDLPDCLSYSDYTQCPVSDILPKQCSGLYAVKAAVPIVHVQCKLTCSCCCDQSELFDSALMSL